MWSPGLSADSFNELGERRSNLIRRIFLKEVSAADRNFSLIGPSPAKRAGAARCGHGSGISHDFRYDPMNDVYHCPGGLGTSGTVHEGKTLLYRASKLDCDVCPLKPQYCPKDPSRKIPRDIHEHARDVARSFAGTQDFEKSRAQEDRDAVRTLEAYSEARSASIAWSTRRPGRVCACCRPEPAAARVAGCATATRSCSVHRVALELRRASGPADQCRPLLTKCPIAHRRQPTFATISARSGSQPRRPKQRRLVGKPAPRYSGISGTPRKTSDHHEKTMSRSTSASVSP
jgi:hypothetical protein